MEFSVEEENRKIVAALEDAGADCGSLECTLENCSSGMPGVFYPVVELWGERMSRDTTKPIPIPLHDTHVCLRCAAAAPLDDIMPFGQRTLARDHLRRVCKERGVKVVRPDWKRARIRFIFLPELDSKL